ncbi:hypothetical protein [Nonomuraea sp. NPDC049400]|uniref:hypothetical protein n=1 Tax=Nonomuraea sp. NPDC049400 TaxID=3364352 RepID=UPI0037938158
MTSEYAAIHARTVALVQHHRRQDWPAVSTLLAELTTPEMAGMTLASMLKVLDYFLDRVPDADRFLAEMSLTLAAYDGNVADGQ